MNKKSNPLGTIIIIAIGIFMIYFVVSCINHSNSVYNTNREVCIARERSGNRYDDGLCD